MLVSCTGCRIFSTSQIATNSLHLAPFGLSFFLAMPPSIPPVIAPYLSDPPPDSLLLIASVLDAPANWLVVRSISAALQERQDQNAHPINHETTTRSSARRVVFLSLLRPLSLWNEIGKKAVRSCTRSCSTFAPDIHQLLTHNCRVWIFQASLRSGKYSTLMDLKSMGKLHVRRTQLELLHYALTG